ncbi:zinc-binding dehydrogenase [bacterium]|nr:zinc-binding dehydrogenase [bacterium]
MNAVAIHEHGGLEKLSFEKQPLPQITAKEVLVKIKAAALNHLDLWVREGWPGLKVEMPHILGSDVAGIIIERGEGVTSVNVGDQVLLAPAWGCGVCQACVSGDDNHCPSYKILGENVPGTYAEYVKAPAANAFPIPEGLSFDEAAAIPLVFLTAWHMLVERARIKPGETVLVLAAGSGVGSAAIQIAKLFNANVIATAGSEPKLKKAKELGADELINYEDDDFLKAVRELTGGRGVDIVFEHVGKSTWQRSIRALMKGGRLVTCGATTGYDAVTDLRHVFFRELKILGNFMGRKVGLQQALQFFPDKLRPVIDTSFTLQDAARAHERLKKREQFGKVILKP